MESLSQSEPFVGRAHEIEELIATLEDVFAGHGRLVMLAGEPGIGKTRVIEEVLRIAADRNAMAVLTHCYEGAGTPPYWPWIRAIRFVDAEIPATLHDDLDSNAKMVSELLPGLMDRTSSEPSAQSPAFPPNQFQIFHAIESYFAGASSWRPIVLAIDDLQSADRSSLGLLEYLALSISSHPILVIGSYRDTELSRRHPLSQSLAKMARSRGFKRIQLRGFGRGETRRLIELVLEASPSPRLLDDIWGRTEGNPFFIVQVTRQLDQESRDRGRDFDIDRFRVPEGVREAVGLRLNRLSEECNALLRTASVIGKQFDFPVLATLNEGAREHDLLDALEEALAGGAIREIQEDGERYEFTHSLIQQTLAEELSASRRARLHARILEVFESRGFDPARANEFAYQASQAVLLVGQEKLSYYCRIAGEVAAESYAWLDALRYFEEAIEALPTVSHDRDRAAILAGLGTVQMHATAYPGYQTGWDNLVRAFELLDGLGDSEGAIQVLTRPSRIVSFWLHGTASVLTRALEIVARGSAAEANLQWLFAGAALYELGDSDRSERAIRRALSIARDIGDRQSECAALVEMSLLGMDPRKSYAVGLDAIGLAAEAGPPSEQIRAGFAVVHSLLVLGESKEALRQLGKMRAIENELRYPIRGSAWPQLNYACLVGDKELLVESVGILEQDFSSDTVMRLASSLGMWLLGEPNSIEQDIDAARGEARGSLVQHQRLSNAVWLAVAGWTIDRSDEVVHAADCSRDLLERGKLWPAGRVSAMVPLVLAASVSGNQKQAMDLYSALATMSGQLANASIPLSGDRLLGIAAQVAGMHEHAAMHFEKALDFADAAGYRLEVAMTCRDYAASVLNEQRPDCVAVSPIVTRGLRVAEELGMVGLYRQLEALRGRVSALMTLAPDYPDGLTTREVEVLRKLALGRTNLQIAEELIIAPSTAAKHVANILGKTGAANRAEAATYANRHGLLDE